MEKLLIFYGKTKSGLKIMISVSQMIKNVKNISSKYDAARYAVPMISSWNMDISQTEFLWLHKFKIFYILLNTH